MLRSHDTQQQRHLLSIEQTKRIYYNFPDTTANFEKKMSQKQIYIKYVSLCLYLQHRYLMPAPESDGRLQMSDCTNTHGQHVKNKRQVHQ